MFGSNTGIKILTALALAAVVVFIGMQMFYSLTPPRHADHDHAMANLNAGGFLRIEAADGGQRNLVGQPGHILVLHFFDPRSGQHAEQAAAARIAQAAPPDGDVEFLFVARSASWENVREWAAAVGIPSSRLYLDPGGETSNLLGVRRWPETLIYAADGLLVHQAKGGMDWSSSGLGAQLARARAGVEEMH